MHILQISKVAEKYAYSRNQKYRYSQERALQIFLRKGILEWELQSLLCTGSPEWGSRTGASSGHVTGRGAVHGNVGRVLRAADLLLSRAMTSA